MFRLLGVGLTRPPLARASPRSWVLLAKTPVCSRFYTPRAAPPRCSRLYATFRDLRPSLQRLPRGSPFSKLLPLAAFSLAFCGTVHFFTPYIVAPLSLVLTPQTAVYGLVAANVAVFLAWRQPRFYATLNRYFLLQKDSVRSPWTLLGSAFSHQDFWHLAMNMLALVLFGPTVAQWVGTLQFLLLYLNLCVLSSLLGVALPMLVRAPLHVASLGASGALFSVMGVFAFLFPNAGISLFFFPIPGGAWVAFLGLIGVNAAGFVLRWGVMDYAAHLGGSAVGLVYGWWIRREILRKRQARRVSRGW